MTTVCLLTDYKNQFGSKWKATPYRGGFDKIALAGALAQYGYKAEFVPCANVFAQSRPWKDQIVLYTSSEEIGNNYKRFIEDVVYGLEEAGAHVLPRAAFLRANNNKVFMEIMREQLLGEELTGLKSFCFGTIEELEIALAKGLVSFPCILKPSYGAMSLGVSRAGSAGEALQQAKRISRTPHLMYELRDFARSMKRSLRGYLCESRFQGKFIIQPMIHGLNSDWKVLVYGDHYYVLKRHVRPGDFRASGSHVNYLPGRHSGIPDVVLDMVEQVYNRLDVPQLSVDVSFDDKRPYLFEFQAVYFGTSTQAEFCEEYFVKQDGEWGVLKKTMNQEEVYAWGLAHYLGKHPELSKCSIH